MSVVQATLSNLGEVSSIVHATISEIYPHYYPKGAVDFFLKHHNDHSIAEDIEHGIVYVCFDDQRAIVGTVTVKENQILRLFVLPEYQGKGFGGELLDFAEKNISEAYSKIMIDASFPAKSIYLKRGYKETEYHIITSENGDRLCYDVMVKLCT